jgi:hypothetical protein
MKNPTLWTLAAITTLGVVYIGLLNNAATTTTSRTLETPSSVSPTPNVLVSNDVEQIRLRADKWSPKSKKYRVDPSDTKPFVCPQGTRLDFSNTTFVYEDGTPVNEPFDLIVEEYYTTADIIRAKLTTTSDGRMLETGGMVNLIASNKKGPIHIAESSSYIIAFPEHEKPKDDFKLFYGQWNSDELINWKLAEDRYTAEELAESTWIDDDLSVRYYEDLETGEKVEIRRVLGGSLITPPAAPAMSAMVSPGTTCYIQINKSELRRDEKISKMDYFNWQLANGQTLSQWFTGSFNPNIEMVNDFCNDKLRSEITFQVDEKGNFKSYYISHTSGNRAYDEAIAAFLQTMPALRLDVLMPKYVVDHACILSFTSQVSQSQNDFAKSFRKTYGKDSTAVVTNVNPGIMDYYVMSSTELGWINCDRFVASDDMVDLNLQISDSKCMVALIFDRYNSILRGNYNGEGYTFSGIPNNEPVHILVLNTASDTPQMAYISGNTKDRKISSPTTQPFALNELDRVLRRM